MSNMCMLSVLLAHLLRGRAGVQICDVYYSSCNLEQIAKEDTLLESTRSDRNQYST
jgi:hypothetical protein